MFELMLGDNVARRREYIAENGAKYIARKPADILEIMSK
jgi:DNA gyrase/topoisomerase IV subunit B